MTNLNPNYNFDAFIVGESNRFAFTAAQTVSKEIGVKYNPLCIYGASGLGKTHILHAIGNEAVSLNKDCSVVYLTSENFKHEIIKSIQNGNMSDYRDKIRRADILLVDDVQYFAGKPATLEEFHNTFNDLYLDNKQIVFTCDRKPAELEHIEDRLITRFNWGLTVEIDSPDIETRLAILRKKADNLHISIPDDCFIFIAENIRSGIRELEGALIKISAFSEIIQADITYSICQKILSSLLPNDDVSISS